MANRYMLDANILSALSTHPCGAVATRMVIATNSNPGQLCISVIVAAEVEYDVRKKSSARFAARARDVLTPLDILPLGPEAIEHYARIRVELENGRGMIGANDLLIAAHTIASDSILVTNNLREFTLVQGLRVENWLETE